MPVHCLRLRNRLVTLSVFLAAVGAASGGDTSVAGIPPGMPGHRLKLLFDDYYQKSHSENGYTQGVALNPADRIATNFYLPDDNALPNGTWVLAQMIHDKFDPAISHQAISRSLLQSTDAYFLVCPIRRASGGRADLTENEADLLEAFVAHGGMLGLILNSMPADPAKSGFDQPGLNRIARRFGIEFLSTETKTVLVPVAKDHPLFDGVGGVIYGNGTTLKLLPAADPKAIVLLRDPRDGPHDPIGAIVPFKQGKVLAFGDSGTFGNAHAFRNDTDQALALREMVYGLLPDGPAPAYAWKPGSKLRVRLSQEQLVSCYPEGNRLFALPKAPGTKTIIAGVRALDQNASLDGKRILNPGRYATAQLRQTASFALEIGAYDGRAYAATWRTASGDATTCRLLPKGSIIEPSLPEGDDLLHWQWALINELICAPLKPYAQPGETWDAEAMAPLPHAQLAPVPTLANAPSTYRFEGESDYRGQACYLFTRTSTVTAEKWKPRDFVSPECLSACGPAQIELVAGGLYAVTKFWIGRDSRLPVHTEMTISSSLWWKDEKFLDSYIGTHDWKNYENWSKISFVSTFGRVLTADFESEKGP